MRTPALAAATILRTFFIPLMLGGILVGLPNMIHDLSPELSISSTAFSLLSSGAQELLSSFLFVLICYRVKASDGSNLRFSWRAALLTILFYQLAWMINHTPLLTTFFFPVQGDALERLSSSIGILSIILSFSCLVWGARYYFLFYPLLIEKKSLQESFAASSLSHECLNRRAALHVVSTALIISAIFSQAGAILYPSPAHPMAHLVELIADAIYWIIMTSLCLGLTQVYERRVSDLEVMQQKNQFLANLFGAQGLGKAVVCLLLLTGWQLYTLTTAKPTATVTPQQIIYNQEQGEISLTLAASDPEGHFLTFQPLLLRIAGEDGYVLSEGTMMTSPNRYSEVLRKDPTELTLTLRMKIIHRKEDILQLKDIFLWYGPHRLLQLDMSQADIRDKEEAPESGSSYKEPAGASPLPKTMSLAAGAMQLFETAL
jgi:hypothetical protein